MKKLNENELEKVAGGGHYEVVGHKEEKYGFTIYDQVWVPDGPDDKEPEPLPDWHPRINDYPRINDDDPIIKALEEELQQNGLL